MIINHIRLKATVNEYNPAELFSCIPACARMTNRAKKREKMSFPRKRESRVLTSKETPTTNETELLRYAAHIYHDWLPAEGRTSFKKAFC
jgi:hypothetical protein